MDAIRNPTFIDVEASGFGKGSYPIEVGFVQYGVAAHCFLIQPAPEWQHWDPKAAAVHGLSRETLIKHGRSVQYVAAQLNELLVEKTVFTDAWGHDTAWIALLFHQADIAQRFRLESLRCLLTEEQAARWSAAKREVVRDLALTRHRASTDARILMETYRRVMSDEPLPVAPQAVGFPR